MSARSPTPAKAAQNCSGVMFTEPENSTAIAPTRAMPQARVATSQVRGRARKLRGPSRTERTCRLTAALLVAPAPAR